MQNPEHAISSYDTTSETIGPNSSNTAPTNKNSLSFFDIFWIFMIASLCGLIIETIVSFPIDGIWKDRAGLVWGPFSPLYGCGAVVMTLALAPIKERNPLLVFVAAFFVGGAVELLAGLFFKNAFGIVAWSYIDKPFNIGGYACLEISLMWGLLGLIWIKLLYPPTVKLIERIPQTLRIPLTTLTALFMTVNIIVTVVSFNFWFERAAGQPIETPAEVFFAEYFGDDFMNERFQTMSLWPEIASR